jgi:hypothetical protein
MSLYIKSIVFFLLMLLLGACEEKRYNVDLKDIKISLVTPDSVIVGQKKMISLSVKNIPPGEKINFVLQSSWGLKTFEFEVEDVPVMKFGIKDTLSGLLNIYVTYKGIIYSQNRVNVLAGVVAEPMDTYLGSKSVVADGKDWAMITAIPTDKYGNLIKHGTQVNFDLLTPTNNRQHKVSSTNFGVAFQKIYAQTTSGKTFVGVSIDSVNSKEKELLQVADFPANFTIQAEKNSLYADARQTFKIKTSILKDQNNNIVSEGTLVIFQVTDANNTIRLFDGYTINGVAEIHLQNPISLGNLQVLASVFGGGKSNNLSIPFQSAYQDIPVDFDNSTRKLSLRIGVLRGKLNQLLPNGIIVALTIDSEKTVSTEVVNGYAIFDLTDIDKGKHDLTISIADNIIHKELIIK